MELDLGLPTTTLPATEAPVEQPQVQQQPQVELTTINLVIPTAIWRQVRGQPNWKSMMINLLIDNLIMLHARTEDMSN